MFFKSDHLFNILLVYQLMLVRLYFLLNTDPWLEVVKVWPGQAQLLRHQYFSNTIFNGAKTSCGLREKEVKVKGFLGFWFYYFFFRYKKRFGFPFVICARQNKKEAILKGITQRLSNDKTQEIDTGVTEVKKICSLRLYNIVSSTNGAKL